jgi:hypothetical protein
MAYFLTLVLALGAFVWVTPAHQFLPRNIQSSIETIQTTIASGSAPLTAQAQSVIASVRTKAMELIRRELHRSIDGLVQ